MSLVLAIINSLDDKEKAIKNATNYFQNVSNVILSHKPLNGSPLSLSDEQFDYVYIEENSFDIEDDSKLLSDCLRVLKKNGSIVFVNNKKNLTMSLMISGFMNVKSEKDVVTAQKPNFNIGTAVSLATKKQTVVEPKSETKKLTLDLNDDADDDLVGDEELLDADDLKAPDNSQFDCGSGKTKKACKNCSCGLADQEIKKEQQQREELKKVILDVSGQVDIEFKSACGSCHKGDPFRCATCPYFGMPAFKPGEKVLKLDLDSDAL